MQSPDSYSVSGEYLPKREEWAIINQFKAQEFERLKQMEKMSDREKKKHFKEELDHQMLSKNGANRWEKEQDRKYYEYISKKTEMMKEKEEREKVEKILKRKKVEEDNQYLLENLNNSRKVVNGDSGYHLDIGVKSQIQRRKLEEVHKKEMLDTLDQQLQLKEEEKRSKKYHDMAMDERNLKYQYNEFDKRTYHPQFKNRSSVVYNHYQNLDQYRKEREQQLDHIIVDEAAAKKKMDEDRKMYLKEQQKTMMALQMKQTLDQQVQMHKYREQEKKKSNPEDNSYSVIGNIFKERESPYNKNEYAEYLKKQAAEQNIKKRKEKYMSEEEYRINLNQLKSAVGGGGSNYLDRSVGAIGDHSMNRSREIYKTEQAQPYMEPVINEDVGVVKRKMEFIEHHPARGHTQSSKKY